MAHVLLMTVSDSGVDAATIETVLNKAKDWLRYTDGCWLIHTNQSAQAWYSRLLELFASKKTIVLICEVNLNDRSGQMSPEAWDWMKRVRKPEAALAS